MLLKPLVVLGTIRTKTWQTEGGQSRSKFVVVASEVGASLRFAVADLQKVRTDEPDTDEPPLTHGRGGRVLSPEGPGGPCHYLLSALFFEESIQHMQPVESDRENQMTRSPAPPRMTRLRLRDPRRRAALERLRKR